MLEMSYKINYHFFIIFIDFSIIFVDEELVFKCFDVFELAKVPSFVELDRLKVCGF